MSNPRRIALRPLPVNFERKFAALKSRQELREFYKCGDSTLTRWIAEAGLEKIGRGRPVTWPANLAEIAEGKSLTQLAEALGTSTTPVRRRLKREHPEIYEACRARGMEVRMREAPDDLAQRAPEMTVNQLAEHYKTGRAVVERWLDDAGLKAKRGLKFAWTLNATARRSGTLLTPQAPADEASQAAHFLRRFYKPVYNIGKVHEKKSLLDVYAVGNRRISTAEMMDLARSHGFAERLAA